jgi:hypothetical protein
VKTKWYRIGRKGNMLETDTREKLWKDKVTEMALHIEHSQQRKYSRVIENNDDAGYVALQSNIEQYS